MAEIRVLIADDDPNMADLMFRRLSRMGLQADRSEDGRRALELVERTPYDLILTDIYMPGATGLDILRRAKEKDPHAQVVVVTGSATLDNAVEALNMGAFSYLTKPFEHMTVFDNAVSRALEFRRLIRDNQRLAEIQRRRGDLLEAEVTDRIRQMRRKQQDMVDLLARLPQGVLVVDADGRTVLSNNLAEEFLAREAQSPDHPLRTYLASLTPSDQLASQEIHLEGLALRVTSQALPPAEGKERTLVVLEESLPTTGPFVPELAPVLAKLRPAIDWLARQPHADKEAEVVRVIVSQIAGLERMAGMAALPAPRATPQPDSMRPPQATPPPAGPPLGEVTPALAAVEPADSLSITEAELESALSQIVESAMAEPRPAPSREAGEREKLARASEKVLKPPVVPEKIAPTVQEPAAVVAPEPPPPVPAEPKPSKPARKGLTSRLDAFRQSATAKRAEAKVKQVEPPQPVSQPAKEPALEPPVKVAQEASGGPAKRADQVPAALEALFAAEEAKAAAKREAEEESPGAKHPTIWPPPLPSQSDDE